jgi:hypothetical protein
MPIAPAPADHREHPTYWFGVLEIARERGDFARAAEAQRELRRLGVIVRYRTHQLNREGARHAP